MERLLAELEIWRKSRNYWWDKAVEALNSGNLRLYLIFSNRSGFYGSRVELVDYLLEAKMLMAVTS